MARAPRLVTETEVPEVTDALHAHGVAQTALHGGLLEFTIARKDTITEDGHVVPRNWAPRPESTSNPSVAAKRRSTAIS